MGRRRNVSPARKTTSAKVATKASRVLRDPKSSKATKSAAASALAQYAGD